MASRKQTARKSFAFSTPQQTRRASSSHSRFSMSHVEDEPEKQDNETNDIFKALMSELTTDPLKKAIFMKCFQSNSKVDKSLLEVMKKKAKSPVKKKKFESPTSRFRRKALEAQDSDNLSDETLSENLPRSSAPFDHLLKGVVAYVEIMSNDEDKSAGAKALLTAMGARVVDKIGRGVTHVIFKDGEFQTCRKAKLVNAHLVSVLWLEAVRRNHRRVSEDKYPALATQAFNANVSDLCDQLQRDYADVVKDELERSRNLKRSLSCNLPAQYSEDIIPASQDFGARSILMQPRRKVPAPAVALQFSSDDSSDTDSDIGLIGGEIIHKIPSLDLTRSSMGSIERETIAGINSKLKDFDSSKSFDRSKSGNSTFLNRSSLVEKRDNARRSSSRKNSESNINGKERNSNGNVLSELEISESGNRKSPRNSKNNSRKNSKESNRDSGNSALLSDLENSDFGNKLTRSSRRKSINSSAKKDVSGSGSVRSNGNTDKIESPRNQDDSSSSPELKKSNSSNRNLSASSRRKTINSSADKESELKGSDFSPSLKSKKADSSSSSQSIRRKTINSSANDLSQLRVSDPVPSTIRKNNGKSKKNVASSESEMSDSSEENLSRITRRKAMNSSTDDLSQLRISDPVKNNSSKSNDKTKKIGSPLDKSGSSNRNNLSVLKVADPLQDNELPESTRKRSTRKTINSNSDELSPLKTSINLRISDPKNHGGVSEPISTLRISDASSKRRQTVSSTMSSLRISTASSRTNDVNKSPIKESPPPKDRDAHVTVRKKRQIPINSYLETTDQSDDACQTKQNVRKGKRRLYDPTEPVVLKTPEEKPKKIIKNITDKNDYNVDIAPVLMTPRARALLQKKNPDIVFDDDDTDDDDNRTPPKKSKTQPNEDNVFKQPKTPARRKAQTQKTPKSTKGALQSDEDFEVETPRSQRNRRSTLDFLPKETFRSQTKMKNTRGKQRRASIVCSRFHRPEVSTFQEIVNKLGRFFVEDVVTEKTSHLVIAEPKRTINLLRAMARGCWVLKSEWLYRSLEEGTWLQEEDYEMVEYSPAVQQSRQQRQAFGASHSMDIFDGCGNIYISKSSNPRCSDLQELVTLCKGRITTIYRNAKIVVGEYVERDDITCVTVNWVLDSITFYTKKSLKKYLINPPSRRQSDEF